MAEIKKISTELQLLDKFLDTSGDAGTSGQVLTSTGTGINWVSGGSLPGGPYLPLSAGSSYPLTDNLFIRGDDKGLVVQNAASTTNVTVGAVSSSAVSTGLITLRHLGVTKIVLNANDNSYFTGNVGIGATNPGAKLHVDNSAASLALHVSRNGGGAVTNAATIVSGAAVYINGNESGGSDALRIGSMDNSTGDYYIDVSNYAGTASYDLILQPFLGNVGIGTTSPVSLLHIKGADPVFTIQDTSTGTAQASSTLRLGESGSGGVLDVYWDIKQASDILNTHLEINHSVNGNALTILDNKNVGIGTTSPIEKLQVEGKVYIQGNGQDWNETTPGTTRGSVHFDPGTTTADTGNALTFGASDTPGSPNEGSTAHAGIYTRSDGAYGSKMYFATTDSYAVGSKTRMMIDYNGNVGIGTTSPGHILDVTTSNSATWAVALKNTNATGYGLFVQGSETTNRAILAAYSGSSYKLWVRGDGNVGIGTTSPAQKLHVGDGGIRVEKSATGLGGFISVGNATELAGNYSAYFFGNTASDTGYFKGGIAYETLASTYGRGDMHFLQNSTTAVANVTISDSVMTILNGGNVGIGTTSPNFRLGLSNSATLTAVYQQFTNGTTGTTSSDGTVMGIDSDGDFLINNQEAKEIKLYTSDTQRLTISSAGAVKFNTYNSTNNTGTPTYLLGTDASGNVVKTLSSSAPGSLWAASGNEIYNTNSGGVGIGVTTSVGQGGLSVTRIGNGVFDNSNQLRVASFFENEGASGNVNRPGIILGYDKSSTPHGIIAARTQTGSGTIPGLQFFTYNGSWGPRMTLLNTGNVGIGTTSPNTNLEIGAATNVAPKLRLTLNDSGSSINPGQEYAGIQWKGNDGQGDGVRADIRVFGEGTSGETYMTFGTMTSGTSASTNAVERMRITSGGNVGIGTTGPLAKLHVEGTGDLVRLVSTNAGSAGVQMDMLQFSASPADDDVMGLINMGGYYSGTNSAYFSSIRTIATDVSARKGALTFTTRNGSDFTEKMRITSSADANKAVVAIGITPSNWYNYIALQVGTGSLQSPSSNTITLGCNYYVDSGVSTSETYITDGSATAYQQGSGTHAWYTAPSGTAGNGVTFTERMRITSAGNVGIGTTSPDYKFEVQGVISSADASLQKATFANVGNDLVLTANADATNVTAKMLFNSSGAGGGTVSTKMIIDGSGNVGIGTTSPSEKLEVAGVIESPYLEYKPFVFYDFNSNTVSQWGTNNATLSTPSKSVTRFTTTGLDANLNRTFDGSGYNSPAIPGGQNQIIRIRYKWISGTGGSGEIFYATAGHPYSGSYYKSYALNTDGEYHTLVLDMSDLNSGGTDWIDNDITAIRFDLINITPVVIDIDWIAVGGNGWGTQYFENDVAFMNGNVGIGTTSPQQHQSTTERVLHISNSNAASLNLDATNGDCYVLSSTAGGNFSIYNDDTNNTAFIIDDASNVGIGTASPGAKLEVFGTGNSLRLDSAANGSKEILFRNVGTGTATIKTDGDLKLFVEDAGKNILFNTTNGEKMRVASNGGVGINTTNPTEKLEVNGNVKVQGNIIVNSDIELGPSSRIQLDDTPTASTASGSGTIVNWSVSDATTAGTLYTVKTNGLWTPVDADNEATSIGMLAIALSSNANLGMLLQGFFYKASHGFTIGLPLYISNTAGAFSTTRPTGANDYVRIIGYATSANYIYFDPDKTWVQVA